MFFTEDQSAIIWLSDAGIPALPEPGFFPMWGQSLVSILQTGARDLKKPILPCV